MFIVESYIFIGATEPQQSQKKNSLNETIFKVDCPLLLIVCLIS